jgi:small subunit ribosomal protein S17
LVDLVVAKGGYSRLSVSFPVWQLTLRRYTTQSTADVNPEPIPESSANPSESLLYEHELDIGEEGRKQEERWRKDPIQPYIDERVRHPDYNPIVDDWVDSSNPRWKALQMTFHRPGPFFIGRCVSTKNRKTAMIEVPYWKRWLKYGKHVAVKRTTRLMAHDEWEQVEVGDLVEIRHSRPYSKRKNFVVKRILEKEAGNAYLKEHPEFAFTRSRADLRHREEQVRLEELRIHLQKKQQEARAMGGVAGAGDDAASSAGPEGLPVEGQVVGSYTSEFDSQETETSRAGSGEAKAKAPNAKAAKGKKSAKKK